MRTLSQHLAITSEQVNLRPEDALENFLAGSLSDFASEMVLCVVFSLGNQQQTSEEKLIGGYLLRQRQLISIWVVPYSETLFQRLEGNPLLPWEVFDHWAEEQALLRVDVEKPLALEPITITKPWGCELWYSAIEQRGVSYVGSKKAHLPIHHVLAMLARRWGVVFSCKAINETDLLLLKVLAPYPDEEFGDLYFEMHQYKQEVYVVTHIDQQAWPEGSGAVRLGFAANKIATYEGPEQFRHAFEQAVDTYKEVRDEIDSLLDKKRLEHDYSIDMPLPPEVHRQWLSELPLALQQKEKRLKQQMYSFTQLHPLKLGDVVEVPSYTPHALQHGVRVVEFQNQVYERQIIAYGQKVLTQNNWDTSNAVKHMKLELPSLFNSDVVEQGNHSKVERIVNMEHFEVYRISASAYTLMNLPISLNYQVAVAIHGDIDIDGLFCGPEEAMLLPPGKHQLELCGNDSNNACLLLAHPLVNSANLWQ